MATSGKRSKQLFDAVILDDVDTVTTLLRKGCSVNTRMDAWPERTILLTACQKGNVRVTELLLRKGADVDQHDMVGNTALMEASYNGYEEIVDLLLHYHANVNLKDFSDRTAAHGAAENNHVSILNRLFCCGAAIDIEDDKGKTPLWHAAGNGSANCVELLLRLGANPHRQCNDRMSPIDIAIKRGKIQVVSMLENPSDLPNSPETIGEQVSWSDTSRFYTSLIRSQSTRPRPHPADVPHLADVPDRLRNEKSDIDKALIKKLKDDLEQLRREGADKDRQVSELQQMNAQKQEELDTAARDKLIKEAEVRQRIVGLQETINEQQIDQNHTAQEMRTQIDVLKQQNASLCAQLNTRRQAIRNVQEGDQTASENQSLLAEVEGLRENVGRLERLLTDAETTIADMRQRTSESEQVLSIASRHITLTDKTLGSGSYGEVRIGYWRGCPVAVKMWYETLAGSQHHIDLLLQEVSISWKVHHPNVASVCGVTLELGDEKKKAWIVLELLQGSMSGVINDSRRKGVQPLTLREKVDLASDSLCGLNYLHTLPRTVLHGDLRPTNILITVTMRAKLGDLGAARFSDASLSVGLLSPEYTAPERLDGRVSQKSKETDVYSMGVSVCELFTGLAACRAERRDQRNLISQRDARFLCMQMVEDDPCARPSAAEALTALCRIRGREEYKQCPPRRMVKGKLDGQETETLTDGMW